MGARVWGFGLWDLKVCFFHFFFGGGGGGGGCGYIIASGLILLLLRFLRGGSPRVRYQHA